MVLIKRRSYTPSVVMNTPHKYALRLPSGDGRISPPSACTPQVTVSPESGASRSFSFDSERRPISGVHSKLATPSWLIKVVGALILLSWMVGSVFTSRARTALHDLEYQHQLSRIHHEEALQMLNEAENSRQAMQRQVHQLQHTQKVLQHEKRVKAEMADAGAVEPEPAVMNFLEQRQQILAGRIDALQSYIQTDSKREVIEKYGPGPHRVEFKVEFAENSGKYESFVLEMAPVDEMPHSVHVFLEMVSNKLWDDTMFWSRPEAEHIITSSLANYYTGDTKSHHFEALGLNGVSYAEYSSEFPHRQYTVGFAGRGPIFYINTMNNIATHGPGGQAHHDLPDQADPCFAVVLEGLSVVEKMHQLILQEDQRGNGGSEESWREHAVAHVVQARILSRR